jgi:hypothetical protein
MLPTLATDFWDYVAVVLVSMIPPICIGITAYYAERERNGQ